MPRCKRSDTKLCVYRRCKTDCGLSRYSPNTCSSSAARFETRYDKGVPMKTGQIICWLLCTAATAVGQVPSWSSGTYAYDGSGSIKSVGADYYVYDQAGRLVRGSSDKERSGVDSYQAYTYDAFGNRLTVSTTGTT